MRIFKVAVLSVIIASVFSCASRYIAISPSTINYVSENKSEGLKLEYKYDLLDKKYAKKEEKKGVKLVAVKITNNTESDLVFGKDFTLGYANGSDVHVMDLETTFRLLKQSPATHLFYLLLTPVNLYTTETSNGVQETTSSTPIGLVLGPGLAAGNMIAAGSANTKFKTEMQDNNVYGATIKSGETKVGLVGIKSYSYDALSIKFN
ncbi:hypothetical protein EYD45_13635 [Hyunsoonleella flava]|uniref:Uncharacterized protein n=1 Tax=Hyunsoonleella flava TaxID=2527939 RepID=A0A4Q9FAH3_9FLAO|nr:hypothetical protein [Hyunsoonleella flava]TBN00863.1 hypothetical protein EYD45_13635 [Hyunsoonleella flava]